MRADAGQDSHTSSGPGGRKMSDAQRLVVVSQGFPPETSGLASRMRDTTTKLDDQGWDVDVLTPPPSFHTASSTGAGTEASERRSTA